MYLGVISRNFHVTLVADYSVFGTELLLENARTRIESNTPVQFFSSVAQSVSHVTRKKFYSFRRAIEQKQSLKQYSKLKAVAERSFFESAI